jgi:uncharacterized protein
VNINTLSFYLNTMLTKEQIKKQLADTFPELKTKFNVRKIGLFGSFADNTADENSDIDLLLEFSTPLGLDFIKLCDFLENLFGKKVDVMTVEGLKSIRVESVRDNILKSVEYVAA